MTLKLATNHLDKHLIYLEVYGMGVDNYIYLSQGVGLGLYMHISKYLFTACNNPL